MSVCRTRMPHGIKLRVLQIGSIFAVIFGLMVISSYAQIDPAPKVDIGDIGPTYSNGIVTIEGEIINIDYYVADDESWKMLVFTVEDNTGSIDVKMYTETTDELIKEKNTPAIGDECTVRGSIYIRGEELYLILESSSHLDIDRPIDLKGTALEFYDIYINDPSKILEKRVRVKGNVSWVEESYFDLDSKVRIYFPDYVKDFAPNADIEVIVGDVVKVIGITQEWYGMLEVLPPTMYDVEILSHGGGNP